MGAGPSEPSSQVLSHFRAVQISGRTCFLTMQLVDCFQESLGEQNQLLLLIAAVAQRLFELCGPIGTRLNGPLKMRGRDGKDVPQGPKPVVVSHLRPD
jgi:hypothetical protein